MAVFLSPVGGVAAQFFTNNGVPLSGGKLYTYAAGTTTPAATYTSSSGGTAHANPIVLDSGGRVPGGEIWLTDGTSYKFLLKDSNDVLIATYDNIVGINSNYVNFFAQEEIQTATAGQTVFTLVNPYVPGANTLSVFVDGVNQYSGSTYSYVETSANTVTFDSGLHVGALVKFTTVQSLTSGQETDAALVTYNEGGAGAVTYTVEAKLQQTVSVIDFGADPTGVADSTSAIANAYSASKQLYFPAGTYKVSSLPNWAVKGTRVTGIGVATINYTGTGIGIYLDAGATTGIVSDVIIENLTISGNAAATYGVYLRGITHSVFRSIRAINFPTAALYSEFLVSNTFDNFVCSGNEPGMTVTTATGMYFNKRGAGEQSSNCTIINPIIEGVSGVGIYGLELVASTIVGGTSEGNGFSGAGGGGLYLGANSFGNTVIGLDMEHNGKAADATTFHVKNYGFRNQFINCFCDSTISPLFWVAGGNSTLITGGQIQNLQIDAGVKNTVINGTAFTGTITDNGTSSRQIQTFAVSGAVTTPDSFVTQGTWTPVPTSLVTTGTPVYAGTYEKSGNLVSFTIRVTNSGGGTSTATAGSTNFTLPFSTVTAGTCVAASNNTGQGFGTALCNSNRAYVPSWTTDNNVVITGQYFTV
jgi:hypothetical protein